MNRNAYRNVRATIRANGYAYALRMAQEGRLVPHVFPSQAGEVVALNDCLMTGDRLALRERVKRAGSVSQRELVILYTSESVFDRSSIGCAIR